MGRAPRVRPPDSGELTDSLGRPLEDERPKRGTGFDASDEGQVRERKREAGTRQRARLDALRKAMHDPAFRELMSSYLDACHVFADCRGAETHDTYWRLGERNIGTLLLRDLERASLDLFLTMRKEQIERDKDRDE